MSFGITSESCRSTPGTHAYPGRSTAVHIRRSRAGRRRTIGPMSDTLTLATDPGPARAHVHDVRGIDARGLGELIASRSPTPRRWPGENVIVQLECSSATTAGSRSPGSSTRCRPRPVPKRTAATRSTCCAPCSTTSATRSRRTTIRRSRPGSLKPFVSEANHWMVEHHGIFQGYYFWHHIGADRNTRDAFRRLAVLRVHRGVLREVRPDRVRPRLRQRPARALRAPDPQVPRPRPRLSTAHTTFAGRGFVRCGRRWL